VGILPERFDGREGPGKAPGWRMMGNSHDCSLPGPPDLARVSPTGQGTPYPIWMSRGNGRGQRSITPWPSEAGRGFYSSRLYFFYYYVQKHRKKSTFPIRTPASTSSSAKVTITLGASFFYGDSPRQIWALRGVLLLRSGDLASGSALLRTSRHLWCFQHFESDRPIP